jgi:hypothetical protein
MGSAGNNWLSDLNGLLSIKQNTLISYPKDVIISTLRDHFSKDSLYHFSKDAFGFPNTPSLEGLSPEAGLNADNSSTRIFIGEVYRHNQLFYPAILIRHTGTRNFPLDLSHNKFVVQYKEVFFTDGYNNSKIISMPEYFVNSGAYTSNFTIQIQAQSLKARDDLVELVYIILNHISWWELNKVGVSIKPNMSIGGTSEQDWRNDKIYTQDINLEIYSEWVVKHRIDDFISQIELCLELVNLSADNPVSDPNFDVVARIHLENKYLDYL